MGLRLRKIIGSDKVASHLSKFLVGREIVDCPSVDFQSVVVVLFDYSSVDSTVVNVCIDIPLFAPLEVFA